MRVTSVKHIAVAVAMLVLTSTGVDAQPQSVLTAVYTPLKTAPTASDFAQNFVVIGKFDLTVSTCRLANCHIRMAATNQPAALRVRVGTMPTMASECTTTVTTNANAPQLVSNTVAPFPKTVTVWVCYPLNWTTSAPAVLPTSQFVFELRQANSAP